MTIKYGMHGPSVKYLQMKLNIFGTKLEEDGIFGPLTDHGVKEFQGAHGLAIDGSVGTQTHSMLNSSKFEMDKNINDFFNEVMESLSVTAGHFDDDLVRIMGSLIGGNPVQVPELIDQVLVPDIDYLTFTVVLQKCIQDVQKLAGNSDEIYRLRKRLEAIIEFISYLITLQNPWSPNPLNINRVKVVITGLSQIGRVSAKTPDPESSQESYGWQLLDEYEATAYGCRCKSATCNEINNEGKGCQYDVYMQESVRKVNVPLSQAWCGMFCQWIYRQSLGTNAGLKNWSWNPARTAIDRGMIAVNPASVKPGDMGYIDQPEQHHFIVVRVDGNYVMTLNGNTNNTDYTQGATQCYSGIWMIRRSMNTVSAFYKINSFD